MSCNISINSEFVALGWNIIFTVFFSSVKLSEIILQFLASCVCFFNWINPKQQEAITWWWSYEIELKLLRCSLYLSTLLEEPLHTKQIHVAYPFYKNKWTFLLGVRIWMKCVYSNTRRKGNDQHYHLSVRGWLSGNWRQKWQNSYMPQPVELPNCKT